MAHLSSFNPSFNQVDGAKRHHRLKKGRPLVAGAGKVIANGKLRVELPTVDGDTISYLAIPTMTWRFKPDTSAPKVAKLPAEKRKEKVEALAEALVKTAIRSILRATPADRVNRALDDALDEIATLERRAASPVAPTILNIAAE
jgi:hypothetical protein